MMQWFPMPWMSGLVLLGWLLIQGEFSIFNLLVAILLAWLLPKLTARFTPQVTTPGSLAVAVRLIGVVIYDIVQSNIAVARLAIGDVNKMQSVFITVPVETDHPLVVNLLASIITMTPGTVSARVNEPAGGGRAAIVVHALDCDDPDALVEEIKTRYEQPLREIFKC